MSADVLATIMHVDPIPQIPEAEDLSRYRSLIEDGMAESDEANVLRQRLISHFGEMHPVIIESNRLIRFQNFRLKRNKTEEGA
jgi:predicted ATP-binding protein involved in virulence